jgi:hypothetical protein
VVNVVVDIIVVFVVVVVSKHGIQPKQNHCLHADSHPPQPTNGQFAVAKQTGKQTPVEVVVVRLVVVVVTVVVVVVVVVMSEGGRTDTPTEQPISMAISSRSVQVMLS